MARDWTKIINSVGQDNNTKKTNKDRNWNNIYNSIEPVKQKEEVKRLPSLAELNKVESKPSFMNIPATRMLEQPLINAGVDTSFLRDKHNMNSPEQKEATRIEEFYKAHPVAKFLETNPVAKFVDLTGQYIQKGMTGSSLNPEDIDYKYQTNNKLYDASANLLGTGLSYFAPIGGGGALNSLMSAGTAVGTKAINKLPLAVNNNWLGRLTKGVVGGATSMAPISALDASRQNLNAKDTAKKILTETAFGAGLGVAGSLIGEIGPTISKLKQSKQLSNIDKTYNKYSNGLFDQSKSMSNNSSVPTGNIASNVINNVAKEQTPTTLSGKYSLKQKPLETTIPVTNEVVKPTPIKNIMAQPKKQTMPLEQRTVRDVGNKKVNSYQFDNPEIKPYYQTYSNYILNNEFVPNAQFGKTTEVMNKLKSDTGMTPKEIKTGLDKIIKDNGLENSADAKRVEIVLDDMLSKGFTDIKGESLPADIDYLKLKSTIEGKQYSQPIKSSELPVDDLQFAQSNIKTNMQTFSENAPKSTIANEELKVPLKSDLTLFNDAAKKPSRFRTNTIERSTMMSEELKTKLTPNEFDYIPETNAEQMEKAVSSVERGPQAVIDKLTKQTSLDGGTDAYEAAIITSKLVDQYKTTGDDMFLKRWLKDIAAKTREVARALQATGASWDKTSVEGALTKAQRVVDTVEKEVKKKAPKVIEKVDKETNQVKDIIKQSEQKAINDVATDVENNVNEILKQKNKTASNKQSSKSRTNLQEKNVPEETLPEEPLPEEILSKRIIKNAESTTTPPKEKDVITQMIDELYSKYRQTMPKEESISSNKIEAVAKAIYERRISAEVWNNAKTIVRNKFKNDPELLSILDDYFGKGTRPPFADKTLNMAIDQGLKAKGIKIGDIVKKYYSTGGQQKENLTQYIVRASGLSGEDARILANYVEKNLHNRISKYSESYLKSVFKGATIKETNKGAKALDDIEALSNTHAFLNEKYNQKVLEKINPKLKTLIQQSGIKMNDLVRQGKNTVNFERVKFMEGLVNKLNIRPEDALEITRSAEKTFNDMAKKARYNILKSKLAPKPEIKQVPLFNKVMELINLGAYDDEAIRDLIKQKNNLPILDSNDIKFITETMDKANNLPKGSYAQRAEYARVQQLIADKQIPTFIDKFRGLQRISMILNPKTLLTRNPLGNVVLGTAETIKDIPAGIADAITSKIRGSERTTLINPIGKTVEGIRKGVPKALKEFGLDIKNGVDTNPTRGQLELPAGRTFDNPILNATDNILKKSLQLGDRPFYETAYNSRIYELKKLAKTNDVTPQMEEQARLYALERVFQNDSEISKALGKLKKLSDNTGYQVAANLVIPFHQTPSNILDKLLSYTPVGLIKAATNLGKSIKNGRELFDQKAFVDNIGRSLTGTGIGILGYTFAKKGLLTGRIDKDKDVVALERETGKSPYALKLGDKYFTFDWAQPISGALAMGADAYFSGKDKEDFISQLTAGAKGAGDTFFKQSVLQGITKLLSGYSPSVGIATTFADSTSQTVPTVVKQVAKVVDPYVRETYDPNPAKQRINRLVAGIPFASKTLPRKVDTFGNDVKQDSLANIFILPGRLTDFKPNKIQQEIIRIYDATGDKTQFPRVAPKSFKVGNETINLTADEFNKYQRTLGKITEQKFSSLMNDNLYKIAADNIKAKALQNILTDANNAAKIEILKGRGIK